MFKDGSQPNRQQHQVNVLPDQAVPIIGEDQNQVEQWESEQQRHAPRGEPAVLASVSRHKGKQQHWDRLNGNVAELRQQDAQPEIDKDQA